MIPEPIKQGIFAGESGGDYNALFGFSNRPGQPFSNVRLTDMSVNDVIRFTDPSSPYAQWVKDQLGYVATPVGGYQVVGTTLRDAVRGLGLTGNERFDQATQDAIGSWIYQTQGTGAWEGYRGPQSGGAPMGLLSMSTSGQPQQPEQPRTFWERLGDAGPMLMMMDPATRDAGVAFYNMNAEKQGKAEETQAKNRTLEWLRSQAAQYPQLAPLLGAAESGSVDMGTVVNTAFQVIQDASKPLPPVDPWANAKVVGESVVVADGQGGFKPVYTDPNAGGPLVEVNTGENSSAFTKKADEAAATRFDGYIQGGAEATRMMGDIQTLTQLGTQIETGATAEAMAALGPYAEALGIDVAGLDAAQAYKAIVDRMAPAMRPAGSGASSDFDARQFLSSLPSLGRTPEGNQIILDTLSAIQQHKIAAADIAARALLPPGDPNRLTWQQAEAEIRKLGNPYETFNEYRKRAPKPPETTTEAPKPEAPATSGNRIRYDQNGNRIE